jgi:hypothetical protein
MVDSLNNQRRHAAAFNGGKTPGVKPQTTRQSFDGKTGARLGLARIVSLGHARPKLPQVPAGLLARWHFLW